MLSSLVQRPTWPLPMMTETNSIFSAKYFEMNSLRYLLIYFHMNHPSDIKFYHAEEKYDSSNTTFEMIYRFQYLFISINFVLKLVATSSCKSLINFRIFALADTSIMACTRRRLLSIIVVNSPNVNVLSFLGVASLFTQHSPTLILLSHSNLTVKTLTARHT